MATLRRLARGSVYLLLALAVFVILALTLRPPMSPPLSGAATTTTGASEPITPGPTLTPRPPRKPPATTHAMTPGPGVAEVLAQRPAAGSVVEVDAYFSGAGAPMLPGGPRHLPDQVACPAPGDTLLTDQPFQASLFILNGVSSNSLPDSSPWLIAATPEATKPGVSIKPDLPYHARLRGHFREPAFAHCQWADRIFVVEEVVEVYEQKPSETPAYPLRLPADFAAWPRHHDAPFGYSLPVPPDWQVADQAEPGLLSATAFRAPDWPDYPAIVRLHEGETHYDQYEPAKAPPLLQGEGFGVFSQGGVFAQHELASQGLAGYRVDRYPTDRQNDDGHRSVSILFSGGGRTYELYLLYPVGFAAPQPLLTAYSAIVEGFRLDALPGPTPTPPIKQTLGHGPFLTQEQAASRLHAAGGKPELLSARLVSEAEARQEANACATFTGHPDGVWLLTVRGTFEDQTRTMRMFLDANSGEQLCGEEIAIEATPVPTLAPDTTPTGVSAAPSPSSDLDGARRGLISYFELLSTRRYAEAVGFYGGSYEALQVFNPQVRPHELDILFKEACENRVLQCLPVKRVVAEKPLSPELFEFRVEFLSEDGDVFVLGPCCGATEEEMPSQSEFIYTARKTGDRFLVQELPVYVP